MKRVLGAEHEEQLAANLSQLSSWQRDSEGLSHCHDDPYADSSIVFGTHPDLPMDHRETRRLVMKRKVLRHRPDGRVEVSDESPNIEPDKNEKPWYPGHSRAAGDDTSSREKTEPSSGALEDYLHDDDDDDDDDDSFYEDSPISHLGGSGSDTISEYSIPRQQSLSYIAPRAERQKRTDPVAILNKYKQEWQKFSFPGQDSHQNLRWAVRNQMLQAGLPRRAQKHVVLNKYEVPTMKKRDSLRFGVRWDMAHSLMPRRNASS